MANEHGTMQHQLHALQGAGVGLAYCIMGALLRAKSQAKNVPTHVNAAVLCLLVCTTERHSRSLLSHSDVQLSDTVARTAVVSSQEVPMLVTTKTLSLQIL